MMDTKNYGVFLFCMLTLFNFGSLLFLLGFFPDATNNVDSFKESDYNRPTTVKGLSIQPPRKQYDQIILMIVDALRYDFMKMNENIPFAHAKRCNLLKLKAANPTVTMPRIKSLMTGKLSSFIDIIRNLGEAEELTDSLIHVLKKHGYMINFAGDRTWTQLFKQEFTRAKANLDSLYVQDFYEGDRQVNETLKNEINQTDWSFFILHFLGLDHIGHVEGSNSAKIPSKLMEMDKIMHSIYKNSLFKNRLLLVTGDHGMRNGGGHGGSTEQEVQVPLMFFTQNCNRMNIPNKDYKQIDVTPTLAMLFSVEIPKPSIGCLIPELLFNLTYEEKLYAFFYNARHLMNKVTEKYGKKSVKNTAFAMWYESATNAHKKFLEANMKNISAGFDYEQALADYKRTAESISSLLEESLVTFDYTFILVGLLLTTIVTVNVIIYLLFQERKASHSPSINQQQALLSIILAIIILFTKLLNSFDDIAKNIFCTLFIGVIIYITCNILKALQKLLLPVKMTSDLKFIWCFPIPVILCYFLTVILLASSSYIEYEELSAHYLGCTCLMLLLFKNLIQHIRRALDVPSLEFKGHTFLPFDKIKLEVLIAIVMLLTIRLFRRPQDAGLDTLAWFQIMEKYIICTSFVLGLLILLFHLKKLTTFHQMIPCAFALFFVFIFRLIEGQLSCFPALKISAIPILMSFCLCIKIITFLGFKTYLKHHCRIELLKSFIVCVLLAVVLLYKPRNVILLPSLLIILDKIYSICDNFKLKVAEPVKQIYILTYKTFMTIFMANMFYFHQGNTNSLATIDLNPGFIGQSTYNPIIATILLTINTYTAPIIAFFYLILHILKNECSSIAYNKLMLRYNNLSSDDDIEQKLKHVLTLYTAATMLPTAVYLALMILFRYHLFIYSVFAPKFFYVCYNVIVFYITFILVHIYLCFKNSSK